MDSDEATQEQLNFIARVKRFYEYRALEPLDPAESDRKGYEFRINEPVVPYETEFTIPRKFQHVDLEQLGHAKGRIDELLAVIKKVHPWSSLHYGLSAVDVVRKLYLEWIPKYFGEDTEIQVLSPMTRGSLGTVELESDDSGIGQPPRAGQGPDQRRRTDLQEG